MKLKEAMVIVAPRLRLSRIEDKLLVEDKCGVNQNDLAIVDSISFVADIILTTLMVSILKCVFKKTQRVKNKLDLHHLHLVLVKKSNSTKITPKEPASVSTSDINDTVDKCATLARQEQIQELSKRKLKLQNRLKARLKKRKIKYQRS